MRSARYVGPLGGMALAFGAGIAILAGAGVASADTDDSSAPSSSSSSTSSSSSSSASPSSGSASEASAGATTATADDTSESTPSGGTKVDRRIHTKVDRRIQLTVPRRTEATTGRVSTKTALDEDEDDDADEGSSTTRRGTTRSSGDADEPTDTESTDSAAQASVLAYTSTLSNPGTQQISAVAVVADDPPPADSPDEVIVPAVARQEPFDYTLDIKVNDNVITGTNIAPKFSDWNNPLTYTVIGAPVAGGKVNLDETKGNFTFLPYTADSTPSGADQFRVLITETTWFDSALERIPILKYFVKPILLRLHQVPILTDVLAPLIGRSMDATVYVNVDTFVGEGEPPIAFTTTVRSFDGTPISVNWFPESGLTPEGKAPTILNGPSLATAGYTDPTQETTVFGLVPGLAKLRAAGYNVVTWDPRGEFASGGILHLDSEDFEARDVSAIIDWVAEQSHTEFDDPRDITDPRIGMVGGSYGGGIQLTSAGIDSRIDAIAPGIAWNSLDTALYPSNAFKTSWASLLLLSLVVSGSRIDPEIYAGIATGVLTGFLTEGQQDFLSENSPSTVIGKIKIPTLFLQGTVDGLFTLQQALNNAKGLNPAPPVKMIWYCGGHGDCLDLDEKQQARQTQFLVDEQLAWMDRYVKHMEDGAPPPIDGYKFSWIDQRGDLYSSNLLPTDGTSFYGPSIPVSGTGGLLPILPILGGSGPQRQSTFPLSITLAAPARDALNIPIPTPATKTYLVGAPELKLTYTGLGTSRNIYAQIVDLNTGRTLGNLVTPIPVRLDGRKHTVTVSMENIAYTVQPADDINPGDKLALQIVDSATAYENFSSFGAVHVSNIDLTLPTAANVIPRTLPPAPPGATPVVREPRTLEDLILGTLPR